MNTLTIARKNLVYRLATALVLAGLLLSLLGAGTGPTRRTASVIVQSTDTTMAAAAVRSVGGQVTRELGIINAVAALLNAAHPDVGYAYEAADVIAMVNNAYVNRDYEYCKDQLEPLNEGTMAAFGNNPPTGDEGCTPGYWKNHVDSWNTYGPSQRFNAFDVFGVGPDKELLKVLKQGGGHEKALGRHAVAALLNAAHLEDYEYSVDQVIGMVKAAYTDKYDYEDIKDLLELENEGICPLGKPSKHDYEGD